MNRRFLITGLAWAVCLAVSAATPRAWRVDAGDHYLTPTGPRVLQRVAGAVVIHLQPGTDAKAALAGLTAPGGALEGYTEDPKGGRGIKILLAPKAEREGMLREPGRLDAVLAAARRDRQVFMCNPVFVDPESGLRLIVTQDIAVRIRQGVDADSFFRGRSARARKLRHTADQYLITLPATAAGEILAEVDRYAANTNVVWAAPDFLGELVLDYTPNDPLYANQWHLQNAGLVSKLDADVDAPGAWDSTQGTNKIVIAILDNGVQLGHPDLSANIFTNTGETLNGIDDDGNGYVDDIRGWNFWNTNNDPNPVIADDNHGTPVAGTAAAVGDNGIGVVGAAYRCKIMSVKISSGPGNFVQESAMAAAVRYAAGLDTNGTPVWRGADVFNMSHGYPYAGAIYDSALDDATALGRNGKGCVLFASAGNLASGFEDYMVTMPTWSTWTCRLEFVYRKDASGTDGDDRVWLANVVLPDAAGTRERFDQLGLPAGWTAGGDVPFGVVDDHEHAYGTGRYVARSGAIGNSQTSWIRTRPFRMAAGQQLFFQAWVSTKKGTAEPFTGDWFYIRITNDIMGAVETNWIDSGIPGDRVYSSGSAVDTVLRRPATHSNVIAVGGSTDLDYRYDGSRFGSTLDFVTPTKGGIQGIWSTDRTGSDGYNWAQGDTDYMSDFSGTSAACPLAAGIGALLLSADTNLTWQQVRARMRASCEKIGGLAYDGNGWNQYYGYGRVNAWGALLQIPYNLLLTNPVVSDTRDYYAYNTITARDDFRVVSPGQVGLSAGARVDLQEAFEATTGTVFNAVIDPDL